MDQIGKLYLVGTPIGNLEDMSMRALRVLQEADEVYCEDTRRTLLLFKHFRIKAKNTLQSFHDHSTARTLEKIKEKLQQGLQVAYVSDAGMPVISDPGYVLVKLAQDIGAGVTVVPGPSAALLLFVASGLPSPKWLFHGFFPKTRGEIEKTLETMRELSIAHIFYESAKRLIATIEIFERAFPQAKVVVGRELTKVHEEFFYGTPTEARSHFQQKSSIKGECAIAVHVEKNKEFQSLPSPLHEINSKYASTLDQTEQMPQQIELSIEQKNEIIQLVKSGKSSKEVSKELAKKFRVPRKIIYEFIIRNLT